MKDFARKFIADESGATAIEYGLLASLIAVVIIAGATLVGTGLDTLFKGIADCLKTPVGSLCTWANPAT